jgi:hypothetical protein
MRTAAFIGLAITAAAPAFAQSDTFHGWSKDGSYLVYETHGSNDLVELFFCLTATEVNPTWPAALNEMDRLDGSSLSCVRFIDPNKAPYQWRSSLVKPAPGLKSGGVSVMAELVTDGEAPGYVVEHGGKTQTCYVSGIHDGSKLGNVFWHPNGKWVAAMVDGKLAHCAVTVKPAVAVKSPPGKPAKRR